MGFLVHVQNRRHEATPLPTADTAVIDINWESTFCLRCVTVRWNHSLCMLTYSNGVAWNASPDLSLSPNPNTTPDSDVVLSGELVVCSFYLFISTWQWKDRALIFCRFEHFCKRRILSRILWSLNKRRNFGNPCKERELAELSFKTNTHNVTLWQQQRDQKEPGSTDAAQVCITAVLLIHSGSHSSCHTRCSYPTTTKFTTQ